MTELDGPRGGRGKWSNPGVPKKGWTCINVEDLGAPSQRCEMCEAVDVRYVQYMSNPRYEGILACGVVCAGHMEENLVSAQAREKTLRSTSGKRTRFPARRGWAVNKNGNPQIKVSGFRVTMFKQGKYWKGVVHDRMRNKSWFTRDRFEDLNPAKMAAFDTLTFVQSRMKKPSFPKIDDEDCI